ncbi:hypothetical protein [Raoultibacter timonensis]|uniref:Uncharacterized protein n=1 Tax=Raoultibacter timonensis TaxID=1907662 RepID=A0ABN6MFD4_9ACTN|nr:hypothetical protein [Raoultibacter timonensis]BDE96692.1 hypothetical protein CE91St30_20250 [Raoultibacter timonensis]BDF51295.1 hypothetical protein CE91St31_20250 [Raoultibacter timonensis]
MGNEEKKKDASANSVPNAPRGADAKGPKPPAKPAAPSESKIQDKDAMPDLDAFNFMKW